MILALLALYNALSTPQLHSAPVREPRTIQRSVPWSGKLSTKNFSTDRSDKLRLEYVKKQVRLTILSLPKWHTQSLKKLEIHNDTNISRGLSSGNKMILHVNSIDSTEELRSVFTHEMGHIVDLGALTGTKGRKTSFKDGNKDILSDDPSVKFYQISWAKSEQKRHTATSKDFVSGYAQYDCFEDFAESYLLYSYHGEKFRLLAESSVALQKKYEFMKTYVFDGAEFNLNREATAFLPGFDTTLLSRTN